VESDPMLGGEESPGQRREASRWAPVEEALNRMVSFFLALSYLLWMSLIKTSLTS